MTKPQRLRIAWILSLGLAPLFPAAGADGGAADLSALREVRDDDPGERAVDDPLARSTATAVVFGPYVSIQVNVDALGQNIVGDAANEPSIARNPLDPDNLAIGWRQFDTIASNFRQAGWAYSFDHGASWTFPGVLTPGLFRSDPVLDFDSNGILYYQSLKQDFTLDVFSSFDGGISWSSPVSAFGGDKNWMAIDRSGGIGDGNLYGIWQAAAGCCGQNILSRSINGNASWQSPVSVTASPGIGTLAVGPNGNLYAAGIDESFGQDTNTIVAAVSTNAENSSQTPSFTGTEVNLGGGLGFQVQPNPAGLLGQINVATGPADGPHGASVYVLASVDPFSPSADPADVHFARSTNGGASFSPFVRVNDDPVGGSDWHWMAAIAVAPNGRIDAVWNDTRFTGQANLSQLMYAYSYNEGQTWSPNVAVSPVFNTHIGWPQQNKIGDYYTLVSDDAGTDVAYAATFNGGQDVYYVRLFPDCNANGVPDLTDIAGPQSQDCNLNSIPDDCETFVPLCGFAGRVQDGFFTGGAPLVIDRLANGDLDLSWGVSCLPSDSDYAVYEGALGDFANTAPVTCSTGGTSVTFTPASGSAFYLVVPSNGDREGSYGRKQPAAERPVSASACYPQLIGGCFGG